jgi:hypothetical protein
MELEEMTADQLYDKLADLRVKKTRLGRRRDQYVAHTRNYYKAEMARVRVELRRRGLPVRKPTDGRVLPTAAHIAVEKAAA